MSEPIERNETMAPTEANEANEMAESVENAETIEMADAGEQAEQAKAIEATEVADPAEWTDITEASEAAEAIEPTDTAEAVKATEVLEPTDAAEASDATDATDSTEAAETTEAAGAMEWTETAEVLEPTDTAEATEPIETMESTEAAAAMELADAAETAETAETLESIEAIESAEAAAAIDARWKGRDRHSARKADKKGGMKIIVIILAIIVVLLGGGLFFYVYGISATDPGNQEDVIVTVESGSGAQQILNQLDEAGLVQNQLCGRVYLKLSSPDSLQANTYVFNKSMTLTEMFGAMNTANPNYIAHSKITIIEGATIKQAAEAISQETEFSKKEILNKWADEDYLKALIDRYWFLTNDILDPDLLYPLEGYLYPETYFFSVEGTDLESLTEAMLDKMDQELTPYKDDIKNKLDMTVHQFLSFASVVEAESLFESDRAKIAGVFKNRLDQNMALQSDITVLYALGEKKVNVSIDETNIDSKYNTYKHKGLPVGPVCAVPARTMEACVNYEPSDYLFFFATQDGEVLYSKTYAEHEKKVEENKWY